MHKFMFMVVSLFACNMVQAEWLQVEHSDIQTSYADSQIVRSGWNKRKMALLSDYVSAGRYDGKPFLSILSQYEFNCKDPQSQMLSYTLYAEHMGQGAEIYSSTTGNKWKAMTAGSLEETLWKMACEKHE